MFVGSSDWRTGGPPCAIVRLKACFAVFVATIAGIMTAPLPMAAIAIIGATVATLVDVVEFKDVVAATGTDLVWLILLAFFISRGVIKTGLGRRIALLFMRLMGRRTVGLGYGLAVTELIMAPAMPSITARAGGVLLPITRAIAEVLGSRADDESRQGVKISWTDWALASLVPGLICLALIPILLLWIAPPEVRQTPDATALAQRELDAMGPSHGRRSSWDRSSSRSSCYGCSVRISRWARRLPRRWASD